MYILKCKNVYLYRSSCFFVFCMSDHIFVLADKSSDLAGHMVFQKKKDGALK